MQGIEYVRLTLPDRITPDGGIRDDLPLTVVRSDHGVIGDVVAGGGAPCNLLGVGDTGIFDFLQSGHVSKQTAHPSERTVGHDKISGSSSVFFQHGINRPVAVPSAGLLTRPLI